MHSLLLDTELDNFLSARVEGPNSCSYLLDQFSEFHDQTDVTGVYSSDWSTLASEANAAVALGAWATGRQTLLVSVWSSFSGFVEFFAVLVVDGAVDVHGNLFILVDVPDTSWVHSWLHRADHVISSVRCLENGVVSRLTTHWNCEWVGWSLGWFGHLNLTSFSVS